MRVAISTLRGAQLKHRDKFTFIFYTQTHLCVLLVFYCHLADFNETIFTLVNLGAANLMDE